MKKKSRGVNAEIIRDYLIKNGQASAIDIQKSTKVKGNIYTKLQGMVNRKIIKKVGKLYQPTLETTIKHDIGTEAWEKKVEAPQPAPQPNPYINMLKREHEHIMQGIQQLRISANYINLRIKELERAEKAD